MVPMTMPTMAPVSRPDLPPELVVTTVVVGLAMGGALTTVVVGGLLTTVTVATGGFCRGRRWERRLEDRGRVGVGAILIVGR